jgi:hypothetical protein
MANSIGAAHVPSALRAPPRAARGEERGNYPPPSLAAIASASCAIAWLNASA